MASGRWRPASFKSTGRTRVAGNVAEMSQGRQGTLSQRDGVGGGREMEGREEEGGEIWRRVASALKRPFGHPFRGLSGTFPVLVRYLSGASCQSFRGPLPAQSCGKERAPDHNHGKRRGRLTTCESSHSRVWHALSFLPCVDSVRARSTQKKNILAERIPRKKINLWLRRPFLPHLSRRLRVLYKRTSCW